MQEEDFYYNNGNIENDNERYRENMNRFYNLNENNNMNKRENNNINNINNLMNNENIRHFRQYLNDNLDLMINRNPNQILEPKENNVGCQPQNPNYSQNIPIPRPLPPDLNPNYHPNIVPNFIPILASIPICLDSRIPFQNNLGLPPNFNNQIPGSDNLSQKQIIPNMPPNFGPNFNKHKNQNNSISNDNCNNNIISLPRYKSNLDFRNLNLPDIRNKILNIAQYYNYNLTEKEKRMLFDDNIVLSNDTIFINEYMFYSPNRISIYAPHIIRATNDIVSLLISKDLNWSDFQYSLYYKKNNNDTFLKILLKRIKEYNDADTDYNEKKFGFDFDINNNYYYLYSTIDEDEDIISNKLKESQYDNNKDYLEELTFEELILYIILEKLQYKYELLPRIIYYEYYLTVNGDRVIFDNNDLTGYSYSHIDYVIYSKCDCIYNKDESPLIIKERYKFNSKDNEVQFEIKKDTLYFFILRSSLGSITKGNNNFFGELFQKYEKFVNLYKSRAWISDKIQKEIMLICDNYKSGLIYNKYEKIIRQFLMKNRDCSLNVVYSKKSYCFDSKSLSIKKYNEVKNENENLKREIDKLNQKLSEVDKK